MHLLTFFILSVYLKYVKVDEINFTNCGKDHIRDDESQRKFAEKDGYYEYNVEEDEHEIHYMDIRIYTKLEFRTAVNDRRRIWLDGIVPYVLSEKYDAKEKSAILEGMAAFKNRTCVRFIPRTKEEVYISVQPGIGCSATIGMFVKSKVKLGRGCYQKGIIIHELMHVLGFVHEQSRPDRDMFVKINYDNILEKHKKNFDKAPENQIQTGNVSYDYGSIMHYGPFTFAKNKNVKTVIPLQKGVEIGQREDFSKKDIEKINLFYHCKPQGRRRRVKRHADHPSNSQRYFNKQQSRLPEVVNTQYGEPKKLLPPSYSPNVRMVGYGQVLAPEYALPQYAPAQNPGPVYQPIAYPDSGYSVEQRRMLSYPPAAYPKPSQYDWSSYSAVEQPKIVYPSAEQPRLVYPPVEQPKIVYSPAEQPKQVYPSAEQPKLVYPQAEQSKQVYPSAEQPKLVYPQAERPKLVYPSAGQPQISYSQADPPRSPNRHSYSPTGGRRPVYSPVEYRREEYFRPTYAPVKYARPYPPEEYPKPVYARPSYTTAGYRRPPYALPDNRHVDYPSMYSSQGYYRNEYPPVMKPYTLPFYETTLTTFPSPETTTAEQTTIVTTITSLTTDNTTPSSTTAMTTNQESTTLETTTSFGSTTPASTITATTSSITTEETSTILTSTTAETTSSASSTIEGISTVRPTSTIEDTTTAVPTSTVTETTTSVPTSTVAETTTSEPTSTISVPTSTVVETTTSVPTSTFTETTTSVPTSTVAETTTSEPTSTVTVTSTSVPTSTFTETTTSVPTSTVAETTTSEPISSTTTTETTSVPTTESSSTVPTSTQETTTTPVTTVDTTTSDETITPFTGSDINSTTEDYGYGFVTYKEDHSSDYHKIHIFPDIQGRTALRDPSAFWARGIVPYEFSDKYDSQQKGFLLEAMEEFHNKTCVRFVPRRNQASYIFVEPEVRCSATIGRIPGRANRVRISEGCYLQGTIIHELMHTLGFVHEQNRPDRDQYVIVIFDNILPDAKKNFRKYTWSEVQDFGQGYDYESIMHYSSVEFAVDPDRPTLVPLQPGVTLGQRDGFSRKDLRKINRLYKCRSVQEKEVVVASPLDEFKKYFQFNIQRLFRNLLRAIQNFKPSKPKNT